MITGAELGEVNHADTDQECDLCRRIDLAIAEWLQILGTDRVVVSDDVRDRYEINELAVERSVLAALKPVSTDEVVAIVNTARKHRIPLYPISTGRNWGYGGASPVRDDCVVVDLSGMNRVIDFDPELGLITLEPGVTQQQLHQYLTDNDHKYLVPVTGAGPHCSIVGNALERGYGVTPHTDHFGAVTSLEAVIPDGSIYRSAMAQIGATDVDRAFKWGIGPYLDGLFSQSNLGIVTRATIVLAPMPQDIRLFLFSLARESQLEEAVCAVREILKQVGGVTGSINIMNDRRVLSMMVEISRDDLDDSGVIAQQSIDKLAKNNRVGAWTIGGVLYGDKQLVRVARRRINERIRRMDGRGMFFSRRRIDVLQKILSWLPTILTGALSHQVNRLDEAFKVAEGAPSEIALPLCYWKSGQKPEPNSMMDPAKDGCGLIWYSPLVPMKPERVRQYVQMVNRICREHRMEPLITLTSLSTRCFDSTVPLLFDRSDPDETARAKRCYLALFKAGKAEGFLPYRVGIDNMDLVIDDNSSSWQLVETLKKAIDPEGIIAPGRYCPASKTERNWRNGGER